MFFFVGGVSERVDKQPLPSERCPDCGAHALYTLERRRVLTLFFIPLLNLSSVPIGRECGACSWQSRVAECTSALRTACLACGADLQRNNYVFCPYCGSRLTD